MAARLLGHVTTRAMGQAYERAGFQLKRVAEHYGVSVTCVRREWKRRGLPFPMQRAALLTPEEATRWYARCGRSVNRAARALHLDYHTVRAAIEEFGVRLGRNKGVLTFVDDDVLSNALCQAGSSAGAARLLGVSKIALRHEMRKRGMRSPWRCVRGRDWSRLREWYVDREHSLGEIAAHVGCDHSAVQAACKQRGIPIRTRGEGQAALKRHGRREVVA